MNSIECKKNAFERLLNIIENLRKKCPWDKKQTFQSLRHLTIEEVYELSDAVLNNDNEEIKKELGDLFLHLVFYSLIASEKKQFDIADVLNTICEKLIYRHPHIYGDLTAKTEEEVRQNWEKLKLKEKGVNSILQGLPVSMPPILKAYRIQEKVAGVGFDWENSQDVWNKVEEEITEFQQEEKNNDTQKMEQEFGDILFSLINYARFKGINPTDALQKANQKFIKRFQYMEEKIKGENKNIDQMNLQEIDIYWNQSKAEIDEN